MSRVSNWWYLVPIFFAVIGGIIGYFAIKGRDKEKAKNLLILGIFITIFQIVFNTGVFVWMSYAFP